MTVTFKSAGEESPDKLAPFTRTIADIESGNRKLMSIIRRMNEIDCPASPEECEACKFHAEDIDKSECPFMAALEFAKEK